MKVDFKKSFLKDLKKIKNKSLQNTVYEVIVLVESANNLNQIKNLKKLTGYEVHYRIRIGDYRIGLKFEDEVVYFVVFEHRKDIYKGFP
jgi:mRNA interferase RelE/StbE